MHGESTVQSTVEAILSISNDCRVVESIMKSLTPDNRVVVRNMTITELLEKAENDNCTYTVKVAVYVDSLVEALKKTRSTLNDLLLALKVDLSVLSL